MSTLTRDIPPASAPTPKRARILIVEDDVHARDALSQLLARDYDLRACETAEAAEALLPKFLPDIVLTDVRLPGESGLKLVPKIRAAIPESIVLVMTAFSSIEWAVNAVRAGARDFFVKPLDFGVLERVIQHELDVQAAALSAKHQRETIVSRIRDEEVWGDSQEMQELLQRAAEVAPSQATVVITGESGTGKEVLARFLHRHSVRADGPFIGVNCGAVPETLLESEFFGHEEGAFTGARAQKLGWFERANGGVIFLDEIGELTPNLQVKLLRVLQERQIERIGGTGAVDIDVRVIAATNRNLDELRRQGRFREDLFYRLNVFHLHMPPLRERKGDIGTLWNQFLARYAKRERLNVPRTSPEAMQSVLSYQWPGNVRELENAAEHAVIRSHGVEIELAHLPSPPRNAEPAEPDAVRIPGSTMEEIEKTAILKTLASVNGSTSQAAQVLGISVRKIQYRMREWRRQARGRGTPAERFPND